MDVENIRPGTDFVDLLGKQVSECDVMLAVIGQGWLNAQNSDGQRRLENPNDFVRIEIEAALHLGKRIIPVLVHNAQMPAETELPDKLKPLARLQAVRLTHERFHADVQGLIDELAVILRTNPGLRDNSFTKAEPIRPPAFYFKTTETLASVGHPGEQEFKFYPNQAAYIRLFPSQYNPPVGLATLMELFQQRRVGPMSRAIGGIVSRNKYGPIIIDPEASTSITGLTQGFATGELWGLNAKIFMSRPISDFPRKITYTITTIPVISFEKLFIKTLTDYVDVAGTLLRLSLPYTVELGVFGLEGNYLDCPGGELSGGTLEGPIMQNSFQKTFTLPTSRKTSIDDVLRSFFVDFYDLAACDRARIITAPLASRYALP